MSAAPQPSFGRALLVPALLALGLGALLLRSESTRPPTLRPPLPTPVVLDELVPQTAAAPGSEPATVERTKEGLRSLQAR